MTPADLALADAPWLTVLPPVAAILIAVVSRNVFYALGAAMWLSETFIAGMNPALGLLGVIDRAVGVFESAGNTRILLFCLIIGALIAFMQHSGGISAMVAWLTRTKVASTPRRASLATAFAGIILFVETNISLLASGIMGRPLFDANRMSRERLAYFIDSTSAPVSVLIPLNGWGAYALALIAAYEVGDGVAVLIGSIGLNFYALLTVGLVLLTALTGRVFGPMRTLEHSGGGAPAGDLEPPSHPAYMGVPILILVGGALAFMAYTGGGNILQGSGSQSILWAVVIATLVAFLMLRLSGRATTRELGEQAVSGMGALIPAVTVIFLALALGDSLKALGTGDFIASLAQTVPAAFLLPAMVFLAAALTSFATGTSWGTYAIIIPIAMPLALGAGIPPALMLAAVLGGGVFGDHCSPISDTSIIASFAAGCDHIDHVRTQLPYALLAAFIALGLYALAGYLMIAAG